MQKLNVCKKERKILTTFKITIKDLLYYTNGFNWLYF